MATSIKIDTETKQHIQLIADRKHRSPHWIMLEAIRDYIKRDEVKEQLMSTQIYENLLLNLVILDIWLCIPLTIKKIKF